MASSGSFVEAPQRLRAFVRARASSMIVVAALIGAMSGLFVAAMSAAVEFLHVVLFKIPTGARLSGLNGVDPVREHGDGCYGPAFRRRDAWAIPESVGALSHAVAGGAARGERRPVIEVPAVP